MIDAVLPVAVGRGIAVVPDVDDYDEATASWQETEHRVLDDPRAVVAAWRGSAGSVRISRWPYDEVCVILSGRVAVEAADGGRREFGAGDAFVVPAGFDGWWHTLEPAEKVFVALHTTRPATPHDDPPASPDRRDVQEQP